MPGSILWNIAPTAVAYVQPYLIALQCKSAKNYQIEVHNKLDSILVQTLTLPAKNFKQLAFIEGSNICLIASRSVVSVVRLVSIEKQLDSFLNANKVKEASQLLDHHALLLTNKDQAKKVICRNTISYSTVGQILQQKVWTSLFTTKGISTFF
jgi:hypothetical protein